MIVSILILMCFLSCAGGLITPLSVWRGPPISKAVTSRFQLMVTDKGMADFHRGTMDRGKSFKRYMQIATWKDPELEALYPNFAEH